MRELRQENVKSIMKITRLFIEGEQEIARFVCMDIIM